MRFLLHQLLSESARNFPDREAIVMEGRSITYAQLETSSNRVANMLIANGTSKGDCIGLFFDRSIESIVAACGILKAGACYVPIDSNSPPMRIAYIVTKCRMKALFTFSEKLPRLDESIQHNSPVELIVLMDGKGSAKSPSISVRQIDIGTVPDAWGRQVPDVDVIGSDIAYILFTSGTTGHPKGVMISHLNAMTFIESACGFFEIRKEDRFSNIAPLQFDMSVFDIYVAFRAGACVVIIPESMAVFPSRLAKYISETKITVWSSTPSALSILSTFSRLKECDLSNLRLILFAGELFPMKYLRILLESIPGAKFCNLYGQTEANTSTYYWVDGTSPENATMLPIGRALPNFEVFALDEAGNKIDRPGQEGELYVRSSTVAWGYLGDPEKTSAAFVPNPLSPAISERVYKTGDLVQMDSDKNFIFLGRKDHLIKSRGYRIDLAEIQSVISNHPQVKQSIVIAIPDELIGNRIAVHVVSNNGGSLQKDDIKKYCAERLAKYMVPEMVEFHQALPMTSSGKIDRKQLEMSAIFGNLPKHAGSEY